ncbi:MAG: FISUMP domain-containing protein [Bacteroidales bacterium]|nr:FISUMP domain-containing protein [Bacteroidales bacterium]
MKTIISKTILVFAALLLYLSPSFGQNPDGMSYQAVIRDASDNLIIDTQIGMQISILQGSVSGPAVYVETQTPTTNANGLVSFVIGGETGFDAIDWANGPYFIKTETDLSGGVNYTITGASQLLSVPYALHAKTAENGLTDGSTSGDMQYWNGTAWVILAATGEDGANLQLVDGVPTWVGGVAPPLPSSVTNPTTGKIWMDRNLGASQVATSNTDAASYGDLYQWGRGTDGHEKRTSGTTSILSTTDTPGHGDFITTDSDPYDWRNSQNDDLWQGVNGINNPCPSDYRLPTEAEWEAERTSWGSNNSAGAFSSPLKLPVAGYRISNNGLIHNSGARGYYWSNNVVGVEVTLLYFNSSSANTHSDNRANAYSVRCIKD